LLPVASDVPVTRLWPVAAAAANHADALKCAVEMSKVTC
jgi:hypothetical protein